MRGGGGAPSCSGLFEHAWPDALHLAKVDVLVTLVVALRRRPERVPELVEVLLDHGDRAERPLLGVHLVVHEDDDRALLVGDHLRVLLVDAVHDGGRVAAAEVLAVQVPGRDRVPELVRDELGPRVIQRPERRPEHVRLQLVGLVAGAVLQPLLVLVQVGGHLLVVQAHEVDVVPRVRLDRVPVGQDALHQVALGRVRFAVGSGRHEERRLDARVLQVGQDVRRGDRRRAVVERQDGEALVGTAPVERFHGAFLAAAHRVLAVRARRRPSHGGRRRGTARTRLAVLVVVNDDVDHGGGREHEHEADERAAELLPAEAAARVPPFVLVVARDRVRRLAVVGHFIAQGEPPSFDDTNATIRGTIGVAAAVRCWAGLWECAGPMPDITTTSMTQLGEPPP